jgi:hypothetical protein
MSPPTSVTLVFPPALAQQTASEMIELSRISEIERLQNRGRHRGGSGDFTLYVLTPMAILLCLIILGRRLLS